MGRLWEGIVGAGIGCMGIGGNKWNSLEVGHGGKI